MNKFFINSYSMRKYANGATNYGMHESRARLNAMPGRGVGGAAGAEARTTTRSNELKNRHNLRGTYSKRDSMIDRGIDAAANWFRKGIRGAADIARDYNTMINSDQVYDPEFESAGYTDYGMSSDRARLNAMPGAGVGGSRGAEQRERTLSSIRPKYY